MALIAKDKLNILQSASNVKAVADTALDDQELAAVAVEINTAANTGELSITCCRSLRNATILTLEGQNYKLKDLTSPGHQNKTYKISWGK